LGHSGLAVVIVLTSVVHALLIEGTMGDVSKLVLSGLVLAVTVKALRDLRIAALLRRRAGQRR
jgi:hypothetical protein